MSDRYERLVADFEMAVQGFGNLPYNSLRDELLESLRASGELSAQRVEKETLSPQNGVAGEPRTAPPSERQAYVMAMALLQSDLYLAGDEELTTAVDAVLDKGIVRPRAAAPVADPPKAGAEMTFNNSPEARERRHSGGVWCNYCGGAHAPSQCVVEIRNRLASLVGYWDGLDAIPSSDPRPTEQFAAGMDERVNALRPFLVVADPPTHENATAVSPSLRSAKHNEENR